jgi:hypothetical protein
VELARCPQVVEFVSVQTVVETATAPANAIQATQGDVVPVVAAPGASAHASDLVARDAAAYRATNAIAMLPAAPERTAMHLAGQPDLAASAQREHGAKSTRLALNEREQQLIESGVIRAEANGPDARGAAQENDEPQQWIVLTTWEQVVTPATGAGEVADYDMGANPDAAAQVATGQGAVGQDPARVAQPAQSTQTISRETTIRQLILRVYPAASDCTRGKQTHQAAGANPDSKESHFKGSDSKSDLNRTAILPLDNGWLFIQL